MTMADLPKRTKGVRLHRLREASAEQGLLK